MCIRDSLYIDDPEFDVKKYKVSVGFSCRVIVNIENDVVKEGDVYKRQPSASPAKNFPLFIILLL